ncbi:MAG: TolC family protein [Eubacteriales bacterium]|nr:TolC family protein [Eubacteriales bacterium]
MKKRKTAAGAAAVLLCLGLMPVQAFGQASPEFAYSAEKWASLRDDKLEYDEIADLVHEYNNTVVQNAISYKDEKDDSRDDVAQDYYDRANEIYGNLEYPDSDDASYGSRVASALNSEKQAESLMKQGDETVDDGETKKLGYEQTEAGLVKQAQELMISYWSQACSMDSLKARKQQAETAYQSELKRLEAGMSTQSAVLSAKEAVSNAEASIVTAESSLQKTKESLCQMLGWGYGAQVEIGLLPEPELERIAAIDTEADTKKALENSYGLKKTVKQLANARTATVREKLQQTEKNQRTAIANSVGSACQNLLLARSEYEQAEQAFQLEGTSMASAERKLAAGTMTQTAYQNQQVSYLAARVAADTKKLDLLKAMVNYEWTVNGLASVS